MNDRGKLIDVEPLDDLAWRRIDKALFARLDEEDEARRLEDLRVRVTPEPRPRWHWALGTAGALAAAVAVVLILVGPRGTTTPSRIVTGSAPSRATLGDAALEVAPESSVTIAGDVSASTLLVLEKGAVDVATPVGISVQAGDVRVAVNDGRVRVTRAGAGATVEVREGTARIVAAGRTLILSAGQIWPEPEKPAPLEIESKLVPPTGGPAPGASVPELLMPPEVIRRRPDPAPGPAKAPDPAAAPPSSRDLFERAARLEREDPARALALYGQVARGSDGWAANALFAMGRLEMDRGHHDQAARLFRRYLKRFPDGHNAADARTFLKVIETP